MEPAPSPSTHRQFDSRWSHAGGTAEEQRLCDIALSLGPALVSIAAQLGDLPLRVQLTLGDRSHTTLEREWQGTGRAELDMLRGVSVAWRDAVDVLLHDSERGYGRITRKDVRLNHHVRLLRKLLTVPNADIVLERGNYNVLGDGENRFHFREGAGDRAEGRWLEGFGPLVVSAAGVRVAGEEGARVVGNEFSSYANVFELEAGLELRDLTVRGNGIIGCIGMDPPAPVSRIHNVTAESALPRLSATNCTFFGSCEGIPSHCASWGNQGICTCPSLKNKPPVVLDFENCRFDGRYSYGSAFRLTYKHSLILTDCEVTRFGRSTADAPSYVAAIGVHSGATAVLTRTSVSHCHGAAILCYTARGGSLCPRVEPTVTLSSCQLTDCQQSNFLLGDQIEREALMVSDRAVAIVGRSCKIETIGVGDGGRIQDPAGPEEPLRFEIMSAELGWTRLDEMGGGGAPIHNHDRDLHATNGWQ